MWFQHGQASKSVRKHLDGWMDEMDRFYFLVNYAFKKKKKLMHL